MMLLQESMCRPCRWFDATIQILDYPTIICAGWTCVLHIHSAIEECTFYALKGIIDKKTRKVGREGGREVQAEAEAETET